MRSFRFVSFHNLCALFLIVQLSVDITLCPADERTSLNDNNASGAKSNWRLSASGPVEWPPEVNETGCLSFSKDGKLLAAGHGFYSTAGLVRVWRVSDHRCLHQESRPLGISSLDFAGDADKLADAGWSTPLVVHNLKTGEAGPEIQFDRSVGRFSMSADGTQAVTATEGIVPADKSDGRFVRIQDMRSGKTVVECQSENLCRLFAVAYSPTGKTVAAAGGYLEAARKGQIYFWDAATGKLEDEIIAPSAPILSIAYSPDGKQLASGSADGTIRLWNTESNEEIGSWSTMGRGNFGIAMAFSPDGKRIATATAIGTVTVRSTDTCEPIEILDAAGSRLNVLSYSPDGRILVGGAISGNIIQWDTTTKEIVWESAGSTDTISIDAAKVLSLSRSNSVIIGSKQGKILELSWPDGYLRRTFEMSTDSLQEIIASSDEKYLAARDAKGIVVVWERESAREVWRSVSGDVAPVTSIAFAGEPAQLITGNASGQIELRQPSDGSVVMNVPTGSTQVTHLRSDSSGKWLASAGLAESDVVIWNLPSLQEAHTLPVNSGTVTAMEWTIQARLIVAGTHGQLSQWDPMTGDRVSAFKSTGDLPVTRLAFTPDGASVIGATEAGALSVWDTATGRICQTRTTGRLSDIVRTPDGQQLLVAGMGDKLKVWDFDRSTGAFATIATNGNAVSAAFSPNGLWFASAGDDRQVTIRELATGRIIKVLLGHRAPVYCCRFSPDNRWLASADLNGVARVWDTTTWRMRQGLTHEGSIRSLCFSPDSSTVCTGTTKGIATLWNVATGQMQLELKDQPAWVTGVVFSPDARTLFLSTGSWDPADSPKGFGLYAWSIAGPLSAPSATRIRQSTIRKSSMESLCITADGTRLITTGTDGQIVVWDPATLAPKRTLFHNVAFHRGALLAGDTLFAAGDATGQVGIWDLDSGARLHLFSGHTSHVFDITASADGEIVATASEDDTLQFWSSTGASELSKKWSDFMNASQASDASR